MNAGLFAGGAALAFDTASETLALALGHLGADGGGLELLAGADGPAPRMANRQLLPRVKALLEQEETPFSELAAIVVGRGPGSFTGVRIGIASAKGLAAALGCPLFGTSTTDAVAWHVWAAGLRGRLGVVCDAMRKEVYPLRYRLENAGPVRLDRDTVAKPADVVDAWRGEADDTTLAGNGLAKYGALFAEAGFSLVDEELWTPTGEGLLRAFSAALSDGTAGDGDAARVLPVYTRLSDAEENERIRLGLDPHEGADEVPEDGVCGICVAGEADKSAADAPELPAGGAAVRAARAQARGSETAAAGGPRAVAEDGEAPAAGSDAASGTTSDTRCGAGFGIEPPFILAIESSCDETAAAVMDGHRHVLSSVVASQIDFHSRFGGVVPEIASRKHVEAIVPVVQEALGRAGLSFGELDAVAATQGPGLVGSLVVGLAFAKATALAAGLPFIGVNHLEGHLYANLFVDAGLEPPFVALLVSGGHTMLVHVRAWGDYETIGSTLDDAVGEAFDKVAKALGLGYPGGPVISRYARDGDPAAIHFPRAMMKSGDLSFSLSGLKTAVVTYIQQQEDAGMPIDLHDLSASFQAAVVDVQAAKALAACEQTGADTLAVGGGVAANPALREALAKALGAHDIHVLFPPASECGDNASMIAAVALDLYRERAFTPLDADPEAHMPLRRRQS